MRASHLFWPPNPTTLPNGLSGRGQILPPNEIFEGSKWACLNIVCLTCRKFKRKKRDALALGVRYLVRFLSGAAQ